MQTGLLKFPGLVALVSLLSCLCGRAEPKLSVGSVSGYPGLTATVPIFFKASSNTPPNVVALQADVAFNTALLSSGPATAGPALGNRVLDSNEPQPGVRRILVYSLNNLPLTNGIIARIPFTVAPGIHVSTAGLLLSNVVMATAAALPVTSTNANGAVIISPVFVRDDGDVSFFFAVTPDQSYLIQASTTLTNWVTLSTNSSAGSFIDFTDTQAHTFPYRFYRIIPVP